uniref:Uncharacterized protein isoform X2 n=2 Tax=Nicotiana tabacum TaxID=4097 RepID=A0A1S4DBI0_TOBAC|nr:PREDICTED: uncharacterized protein LOC107828056 isoform X2 [Nicotiana tabacum]
MIDTSDTLSSKDIFVATRKRKPGRDEMERIQSTQESEDGSDSVDVFASVMGPEHPEKMEERMQQRMLEKFNAQKEAMEQDIMMNVVIRLQRINPDLRLDPGMLIFNARTLGEAFSAQVVIQPINRPSTGSNNQGGVYDEMEDRGSDEDLDLT